MPGILITGPGEYSLKNSLIFACTNIDGDIATGFVITPDGSNPTISFSVEGECLVESMYSADVSESMIEYFNPDFDPDEDWESILNGLEFEG